MDPWVKLLDLFDKHPNLFGVAFVVVGVMLLVVGAMAVTFGIRFPQRTRMEDGSFSWSLSGGIPGLGSGLVEAGKGLVQFAQTFASEREKDRTAHAVELQATKSAIEVMAERQDKTNDAIDRSNQAIERLTAEFHEVVLLLKEVLRRQTPDRKSSTGFTVEGTDARCS